MAETNGLLNRHRGSTSIEGSNPSLSASILKQVCKYLLFYWLKPFRDLGTKLNSGSTIIEGSPKGTHLCPSDLRRNPSLSASILKQVCKYLLFYWLNPFRDLGTKLILGSTIIEGSPKGTHLCPSDLRRNPSLSAK